MLHNGTRRFTQILSAAILLGAGAAEGAFIRFESEIHTGNHVIAFHNHPSSTANITRIVLQLGTNAIFDTLAPGSGGDGLAVALGSTSAANQIVIGHWPFTASNTSLQVGLQGSLNVAIADGSNSFILDFIDFNPGEAWGIFVDMDTANNARVDPGGSDMSGVSIQVFFQGVTAPLNTSCTDTTYAPGVNDQCYPATFSGTGKSSFPSADSADATIIDTAVLTPEPFTFGVCGAGLIAMGLLRRRR